MSLKAVKLNASLTTLFLIPEASYLPTHSKPGSRYRFISIIANLPLINPVPHCPTLACLQNKTYGLVCVDCGR